MLRLNITGLDAFQDGVRRTYEAFDVAARATAIEAVAWVEAKAKDNFEGSHKRGEPHVGGLRPNIVTGNLRRSITHTPMRKVGHGHYQSTVGPTAVYGRRVQLGWSAADGTPGHQVTRAFPYMPEAPETAQHLNEIALRHWRAITTR